MYSGMFDGIAYVFWGLLIAACVGIVSCSYNVITSPDDDDIIPEIGKSIENIRAIKKGCEATLPRDQECVMVFDFAPVKKEKSE